MPLAIPKVKPLVTNDHQMEGSNNKPYNSNSTKLQLTNNSKHILYIQVNENTYNLLKHNQQGKKQSTFYNKPNSIPPPCFEKNTVSALPLQSNMQSNMSHLNPQIARENCHLMFVPPSQNYSNMQYFMIQPTQPTESPTFECNTITCIQALHASINNPNIFFYQQFSMTFAQGPYITTNIIVKTTGYGALLPTIT